MPHLHVAAFKAPPTPAQEGEVRFDFIASNTLYPQERLIATHSQGKFFFLLYVQKEASGLLKSDKLTRPSPNYVIKEALLAYAKAAALEVVASNVDEAPKSVHLERDRALCQINDFIEHFPSAKRIWIEVGFGSGRHLLHQAKNNPDVLLIGLEIHKTSIEQVLKQIAIQDLDNVLVLDYDARLFLELVPSNRIERIFVHFPVPWDKKPHRRVIGPAFITEAQRVLGLGGTLELRTDSDLYFQYAFETLAALEKFSLEIHKNRDLDISSKYEDRWRRLHKNIYDVTMINQIESSEPSDHYHFDLSPPTSSQEQLIALGGTTHRFDEGFVHFERIYCIERGGLLLRLAMGSFDRPEHLYVLLTQSEAHYVPTLPIPSRANYHAHLLLGKLLHG